MITSPIESRNLRRKIIQKKPLSRMRFRLKFHNDLESLSSVGKGRKNCTNKLANIDPNFANFTFTQINCRFMQLKR